MASFDYSAIDEQGLVHTGSMDAPSIEAVPAELRRVGMTLLSAQAVTGGKRRSWRERLTPEPPPSEITRLTQDLSMLLKGGVALDEALSIVSGLENRKWLIALTQRMQGELASGKEFSKVLSGRDRFFPLMYVKMVEAAEASGRLQQALEAVATERQRSEALRRRLIGAMAYPGFLALAATGVMFFVLLYIIPQFEGAIAGFRDRIAPSTLFVFRLSEGLRDNLTAVGLSAVLFLVALVIAKRMVGKNSVGLAFLARLPLTRQVVSYNLTLTFCRTLGMLIRNGVDVSTSLALIRDILTLPGAAAKVDQVIAGVRGGLKLSDALSRTTLLPAHVLQMLRIGEGTGKIADSADRVADFYEQKLDISLGRLTAILGPVLMMLVSIIVGWLIISVMGALMSINDLLV